MKVTAHPEKVMARQALLFIALPLLAVPARADEAWPVGRGPSREPDPYTYSARALAAVPRAILDDNVAVILYAGATYRIEPDGTIETTQHELTWLGGRRAIEKLGEFRGLSFTPAHQKATLHVARIHKPGGKVVDVEPRHVHLRDVGTDYQSYDTDKQLIVSFPGLEVGDVLEAKWTVRGKNPEHGGQFFHRYSFGDTQYPIVLDDLRILTPKGKTLKHSFREGILGVKVAATEKALPGGGTYYRWQARNCPRPPQDENLPSREEVRPVVMSSTFASWDEVGKWKARIREACWKCTPEVRKVVEEVTRGLKGPTEKARALTYWVRKNIRYLAAGEKHDYTPHQPDQILAARFGDCKDTSQLLAVMLREAGIKVELASLGSQDDGQIDEEVPSPWATHAILAVTIGDKTHWVDTTARLCAWDELPRDDLGRLCYLTDEKGKVRLKWTPSPTPEVMKADTVTEVWIDGEGSMRCKRKQAQSGLAAVALRGRYGEVPPTERRQKMTATLQDSYSRARLLSLTVAPAGIDNHDLPVEMEMEYEVPRHFTGSNEKEGSLADNWTWSRLLAYNIDHGREAAMLLPSPFVSTHVYRVHLPPGWEWDGTPRAKEAKSRWGHFRLEVRTLDGGALELKLLTRLDRARVEHEDLERYREWFDEVQKSYRAWLTMKPGTGAKAAGELEALLAVSPQNAAAARALAKIHLNAGRLSDAWRVLERAVRYTPDEDALWALRVDAADTEDQEAQARRDLIARKPGEMRHILGLASLLVSQGKQEEARKLLDEVIAKGRPVEKARAQYQYARSFYRRSQLVDALERLQLATRADAEMANDLRAVRLKGQVLEELGKHAEALAAFRKACQLDRGNRELMLSAIRVARAAGDELAALELLRQYAIRVEGEAGSMARAAEIYYDMGRLDEARELALRSREVTFHEKAQRVLGLVAYRRGEYSQAALHLERADADYLVLAALLRSHLLEGALGKVPDDLERIEKLSEPPDALLRLASEARAALRRREELARHARGPGLDRAVCAEYALRSGVAAPRVEALARGDDPLSRAVRARLALEKGRLRDAASLAEASLKGWPELDLALLVRGRARLEQDRPGASSDLAAGVEWSRRRNADDLRAFAEALEVEGKHSQALKAAREAQALKPKDQALADLVRRIEKNVKPEKKP
jgi:transglutaminase-like putative cysteine protease/tetratricopeptide (TPR) repeat protein